MRRIKLQQLFLKTVSDLATSFVVFPKTAFLSFDSHVTTQLMSERKSCRVIFKFLLTFEKVIVLSYS